MATKQVEQGRDGSSAKGGTPVLWHLKVSHYNEKARWALDYKRVPHVRRAVTPGRHMNIARRLAGGTTFPVLELDGEAIGDSTRIIEALEHRYPERPLYPADPEEWGRALALEEFFDEEWGPHCRRLVMNSMLPEPDLLIGAFFPDADGGRRLAMKAAYPLVRWRFTSSQSIDDASIEEAWKRARAAGERLRDELQPSGYLVGDNFTVADLTAAALVSPAIAPEQFPYPQPQRGHPRLAPLRDALSETGYLEWAREMYSRHRGRSTEVRS